MRVNVRVHRWRLPAFQLRRHGGASSTLLLLGALGSPARIPHCIMHMPGGQLFKEHTFSYCIRVTLEPADRAICLWQLLARQAPLSASFIIESFPVFFALACVLFSFTCICPSSVIAFILFAFVSLGLLKTCIDPTHWTFSVLITVRQGHS